MTTINSNLISDFENINDPDVETDTLTTSSSSRILEARKMTQRLSNHQWIDSQKQSGRNFNVETLVSVASTLKQRLKIVQTQALSRERELEDQIDSQQDMLISLMSTMLAILTFLNKYRKNFENKINKDASNNPKVKLSTNQESCDHLLHKWNVSLADINQLVYSKSSLKFNNQSINSVFTVGLKNENENENENSPISSSSLSSKVNTTEKPTAQNVAKSPTATSPLVTKEKSIALSETMRSTIISLCQSTSDWIESCLDFLEWVETQTQQTEEHFQFPTNPTNPEISGLEINRKHTESSDNIQPALTNLEWKSFSLLPKRNSPNHFHEQLFKSSSFQKKRNPLNKSSSLNTISRTSTQLLERYPKYTTSSLSKLPTISDTHSESIEMVSSPTSSPPIGLDDTKEFVDRKSLIPQAEKSNLNRKDESVSTADDPNFSPLSSTGRPKPRRGRSLKVLPFILSKNEDTGPSTTTIRPNFSILPKVNVNSDTAHRPPGRATKDRDRTLSSYPNLSIFFRKAGLSQSVSETSTSSSALSQEDLQSPISESLLIPEETIPHANINVDTETMLNSSFSKYDNRDPLSETSSHKTHGDNATTSEFDVLNRESSSLFDLFHVTSMEQFRPHSSISDLDGNLSTSNQSISSLQIESSRVESRFGDSNNSNIGPESMIMPISHSMISLYSNDQLDDHDAISFSSGSDEDDDLDLGLYIDEHEPQESQFISKSPIINLQDNFSDSSNLEPKSISLVNLDSNGHKTLNSKDDRESEFISWHLLEEFEKTPQTITSKESMDSTEMERLSSNSTLLFPQKPESQTSQSDNDNDNKSRTSIPLNIPTELDINVDSPSFTSPSHSNMLSVGVKRGIRPSIDDPLAFFHQRIQ